MLKELWFRKVIEGLSRNSGFSSVVCVVIVVGLGGGGLFIVVFSGVVGVVIGVGW